MNHCTGRTVGQPSDSTPNVINAVVLNHQVIIEEAKELAQTVYNSHDFSVCPTDRKGFEGKRCFSLLCSPRPLARSVATVGGERAERRKGCAGPVGREQGWV